jgi:secreted PhoX family phosphatase
MGSFNHEAVAVDVVGRCCYLTEDSTDGRLYRFVPAGWPSLESGRLQAAKVTDGAVEWIDVASDRPDRSPSTTPFQGGEGIAIDGRSLLFATKHDRRIWELELDTGRLSVFFDAIARPGTALTHVDNVVIHPTSGHLFVAEDGGNMELCMLTRSGAEPVVSAVVRFAGHDGSEVAGPAFSPDGRHLYLSSQRGTDGRGVTVRVTGPWGGRPVEPPTRIGGAGESTRTAVRVGPLSPP